MIRVNVVSSLSGGAWTMARTGAVGGGDGDGGGIRRNAATPATATTATPTPANTGGERRTRGGDVGDGCDACSDGGRTVGSDDDVVVDDVFDGGRTTGIDDVVVARLGSGTDIPGNTVDASSPDTIDDGADAGGGDGDGGTTANAPERIGGGGGPVGANDRDGSGGDGGDADDGAGTTAKPPDRIGGGGAPVVANDRDGSGGDGGDADDGAGTTANPPDRIGGGGAFVVGNDRDGSGGGGGEVVNRRGAARSAPVAPSPPSAAGDSARGTAIRGLLGRKAGRTAAPSSRSGPPTTLSSTPGRRGVLSSAIHDEPIIGPTWLTSLGQNMDDHQGPDHAGLRCSATLQPAPS